MARQWPPRRVQRFERNNSSDKSLVMWTFKQSHVKALQAVAAGFTQQTGIR